MCETCKEAGQLIADVYGGSYPMSIIDAFGKTINKVLPNKQYNSFRAYHILIGSSPEPYHVDLEVPAIHSFIDFFRSEYLKEV